MSNRKIEFKNIYVSMICAFAFVFTFIFFGPCEIYAGNIGDMTFPISKLIPVLVLSGAIVFVIIVGILILLRGKLFTYALSFLFAVTLAGYIQGNFLNIDHGTLDGREIAWLHYKWPMLANLLFWFAMIIGAFMLAEYKKRLWSKSIMHISALLCIMQIAALVSLFWGTDLTWRQSVEEEKYLSTSGMFELSDSQNVVFFLLDRCDRAFFDNLIEQHPEWSEHLNGFTEYHDFTGSFSKTYPSITYLLTGVIDDETIPLLISEKEYHQKAWSNSSFLPEIRETGYQVGVYSDFNAVFGNTENLVGKIDNIGGETLKFDRLQILKKMLDLSAFRYLPEAMKPYFKIYTGDLNNVISTEVNDIFTVDDANFWDNYRECDLSVNSKLKGAFRFYHLRGAHGPFNIDENGNRIPDIEDINLRDVQLTGNIKMIFNYIEKMKEKGIYDDTTIIISTDHAADFPTEIDGSIPIDRLESPRILTLLIKPAHADLSIPLVTSNKQVCQDNLRASIASYFGLDHQKYGRTQPVEKVCQEADFFM